MGMLISVDTRCGWGMEAEGDGDGDACCLFFLGRFFLPSPFPMKRNEEEVRCDDLSEAFLGDELHLSTEEPCSEQ